MLGLIAGQAELQHHGEVQREPLLSRLNLFVRVMHGDRAVGDRALGAAALLALTCRNRKQRLAQGTTALKMFSHRKGYSS